MTTKTPEQRAALESVDGQYPLHGKNAAHPARRYVREGYVVGFLAGIAWRDANRFVEPVNPELEKFAALLVERLKSFDVGDAIAHAAELFMRQNGLGGTMLCPKLEPARLAATITIDPEALRLSKLLEPEQLAEIGKRIDDNAARLVAAYYADDHDDSTI